MTFTILLSSLNIFFGSGEYERYFVMIECPIIILFLYLLNIKIFQLCILKAAKDLFLLFSKSIKIKFLIN